MGIDLCQCLAELKNKLKGMQGYNTAKSGNDMAKLLTMICGYCCQVNLLSNKYMVIMAAIKNLFFSSRRQSDLMLTITRTSWHCLK